MSVGFGFSVGDFLATIKLVGTVIDALRESSHSTTRFENLLNELEALDTALQNVKRLEFDESQRFEKLALYQVAAQCQRSIDAFWSRIQRYQSHLSKDGTNSRLKDGWAKIKWAVCEQGEVDSFRAEIQGHISSIQVLVAAINAQAQQRQYKSLAGKIQDFSLQAMGKLRAIADDVALNVQHGTSLVQTCAEILQTNLRVFRMVYDIQLFITRIPGQVQRQQPVYFIDAFNRECPFHLEFVRSAEAFLAVLKINFKNSDVGPKMIDRGDFVIEELGTNNLIDMTRSWETCFFPGQRVAMSMILRKREQTSSESSCPRCSTSQKRSMNEEITCSRCGTVYRRIEELEDIVQQTAIPERDRGRSLDYGDDERSPSRLMGAEPATAADESTLVLQFRRLRILARTLNTPSDWLWDSLPTNELSESTLREYLTRTFGKHEFHTKLLVSQKTFLSDLWYFCIPRPLTSEEKQELTTHSILRHQSNLDALTGINEDGTLHPFWRPRGFWDGFDDFSDSEDDGLPSGGDTSDIGTIPISEGPRQAKELQRRLTNRVHDLPTSSPSGTPEVPRIIRTML